MAPFEVQVSKPAFLAAQLRSLQARRICLPTLTVGLGSLQVQHIEFGRNELRHDVERSYPVYVRDYRLNPVAPHLAPYPRPAEGFATQVAQEVVLEVTTAEAIADHPNADAPPLASPIRFTAVLQLTYRPNSDGGCALSTYLVENEWEDLPPLPAEINAYALKEAVRRFLAPVVETTVPFNFTGGFLAAPVKKVANAGASVDTSSSFVAFRVEPLGGEPQPDAVWTNFHTGHIENRMAGKDWSLFLCDKLLESKLTFEVEAAVKQLHLPELRVSSVGSKYRSAAGVPQVDTTLHAFIDVPAVPTVYVTPAVHTSFSAESPPGRLVIDLRLDEVKELLELPGKLLDEIELVPPLDWVVELAGADDLRELPKKLGETEVSPQGMDCTALTDSHRHCTARSPVASMIGARMYVDECTAFSDGMAITGRLLTETNRRLTGGFTRSTPTFEPTDFAWIPPHVSCGQASNTLLDAVRADPRQFASLYCEVLLGHTGTTPVFICGVEVLNDESGIFPRQAPGLRFERDLLPTKVIVEFPPPADGAVAAQQTLDLLIRTSAGTRLVRIPPPAAFAASDAVLIEGSVGVQLKGCPAVPTWFDGAREGRFDLSWIEDPLTDPPRELIAGHIWRIAVEGLAPGQTVTLADDRGRHAASARSTAEVPLAFAAVVPPASGTELSLTMEASAETGASARRGEDRPGLEVSQQPLWRASRLPLPEACRAILPAGLWGEACLVAVMGDAAVAFDLADPHRPKRMAVWRQPDLGGACLWQGNLMLYGSSGCSLVGPDQALTPLAGTDNAVFGAAPGRESIYLLIDRGIELRSGSELQAGGTVPAEGLRSIRRVGDCLFVGGPSGLAAYDVTQEQDPHLEAERGGVAVEGLWMPVEGYGSSVLVAFADGTAATVIVEGGELWDLVTHSSVPRAAEGVRIGDVYAQLTDDRTRIDVAVAGTARLAVPSPEGGTAFARRRPG